MVRIPPEFTSALLTALSVLSLWFGTWLARRGKKEDVRLAEKEQTFEQLRGLAQERLAEINRLTLALTECRSEGDRIRDSWEARWSRQMARCRQVTDSLVASVAALRAHSGPNTNHEADEVTKVIAAHNQDDHPDPMPST